MAEFKVNIPEMRSAAGSEESLAQELGRIENEIRSVLNNLRLGVDAERRVRQSLSANLQSVSGEKQKLQALANSLREIARIYEDAEKRILGNSSGNSQNRSKLAQIAADIRRAAEQFGADTAAAFSKDPVNLCTGNYIYEKTILDIDAPLEVCFRIFYNNQKPDEAELGRGWTHTCERELLIEGDQIKMLRDDGSMLIFYKEDGKFFPANGSFGSLGADESGYTVITRERDRFCFDRNGRFLEQTDAMGNRLSLSYGEDGLIRCVKDRYGNSLSFEHREGRIIGVTDHSGRKAVLSYENGNLTAVQDAQGRVTRYIYDRNGWLQKVINPRGITALENEYDGEGRTVCQVFPDGGRVLYDYKGADGQVSLTEQNGNRIVYEHDSLYRNTRNRFESGEESFTYNEDNLRTSYTDAKGNVSRYEYDEQGNMVRYLSPLGDETIVSYNGENQLLSVTQNGTVLHSAKYDERNRQVESENAVGAVHRYEYDESGQPVVWEKPDGSRIFMTYDACGNMSSITNSMGGKTSYEYDSLHRVIRTKDPLGHTVEYFYNDADELTAVTNEDGNIRSYEYDACGNLIRVTEFNGAETHIEYNELNKMSKLRDPLGNETCLEYDEMWNIRRVTDPMGGQTTYEYDSMHHLIRVTDANGGVTRLEYDACGNLIRRTAPDGGVYEIGYDALNRPDRVRDACGRESRAQYDAQGNVLKMTYADGKEESCEYDAAGQQTAFTDRSGYTTRYEYDLMGNVTQVSDERGVLMTYEYYPGGLLKKETDISGEERIFAYDANENVVSIDATDSGRWEFTYDNRGNVIRAENAGGACETYEYDAVGNLILSVDGEGSATRYRYSLAGTLDAVVDGAGTETHYVYDGCQRMTAILQSASGTISAADVQDLNRAQKDLRITTYQRDAGGNITKIVNPAGDETGYDYDACGRVLARLDPDGSVTRCEYNPDGTEKAFRFSDGKSVMMEYDALRQLVQMEDWFGITRIRRDAMGRPEEVTMPDGRQVAYEWGTRGEKKQIRYPDGQYIRYEYDDAMRLKTSESGDRRVDYQYYGNGRLRERRFPFGISEQYVYDRAGNISEVTRKRADDIIESCLYRYNGRNQKVSAEYSEGGRLCKTEYAYNKAGSLTRVCRDGELREHYEYDPFGNRIRANVFGREAAYVYDRTDQLCSLQDENGLHTYRYDRRGNLTEELLDGESVRQIEFNAQNLISRVTSPQGVEEYGYDGWGQRVSCVFRKADGREGAVKYLYDITKEYHNLLSSEEAGETCDYFWDQGLLGRSAPAGNVFFLNNERMAPQKVIGTDGTLTSIQYDSFGNKLRRQGASDTDFGIDGYRLSPISGYFYANAREYDPRSGRFLSRDPYPGVIALPLTLNAYTYCMGDPVNYCDPSGMIVAWLAGGIVGAAVNFVTKAAGDVVKSVSSGKVKISSWQSYVGTMAGGFASGTTLVMTGSMTAAGAAGSAVETFATGGLNMLSDKKGYRKEDGYNMGKLLGETAKSGLSGAISGFAFGSAAKYIKIPGITKGQGSYQSVWKQVMTKAAEKQIADIKVRTLWKGLVAYGGVKFFDQVLQKGKKKIEETAKKYAKEWLGDLWDKATGGKTSVETSAKEYLSGRQVAGECPLAGA